MERSKKDPIYLTFLFVTFTGNATLSDADKAFHSAWVPPQEVFVILGDFKNHKSRQKQLATI